MIRVVLADDQALLRSGLRALLESTDDIAVVAEAATGNEAIDAAREHHPDVLLMDVRMPDLDGIQATARITADPDLTDTRVVILTTFEIDEYIFDALRNGASGFLVKDSEPTDVLRAIRTVAAGDSLLSPGVTRTLIARYATTAKPTELAPDLAHLTDREREVMALAAGGLSNDEIAERLYISPATAKTHISRAMTKLHARDRAQLVVYAYETGLVEPRWNRPAEN